MSRSDNNPHGFLIEKWNTIENKDLKVETDSINNDNEIIITHMLLLKKIRNKNLLLMKQSEVINKWKA